MNQIEVTMNPMTRRRMQISGKNRGEIHSTKDRVSFGKSLPLAFSTKDALDEEKGEGLENTG